MASGTGSIGDRRTTRPYRRRKPLPALIFIAILSIAAVVVWINAVSSTEDLTEAITCDPAPAPPAGTTFTRLSHDVLDGTMPIPPSKVDVRVLNANGTRGAASITTEGLRQLGFTGIGEPGNDPVYPSGKANCHGQIRFGSNGERAARTIQLIDPCLELVRDDRQDASVDLAIGTDFPGVQPSDDAVSVLDRLKTHAARSAGKGASEQATTGAPGEIDEDLLSEIKPTHC